MKNHSYFIKKYLEGRPSFYAFIRPQEAQLFYERVKMMRGPILDFGCGDGFFASTIFKKKHIDVGLDLASSRIAQSVKTNVYKKLQVYDGITIPFKSNTFGTIISNCVFEHVPHIQKSIQEMCRVTRKNGYLMTSVMCTSWNSNLLGGKMVGKPYINWFNGIQHHNALFSKKKWANIFEKSGYKVVEAVDYLYEKASEKTEVYHYLSVLSLVSYLIFGRWNALPSVFNKKMQADIDKLIKNDKKNPSACFFVLRKA